MKVVAPGDIETDLGITEITPTIGIIDYSRRVTDDFGVTTVVPRAFSRRMSVRFAAPRATVDTVQSVLAALRATAARWVASEDLAWLNFDGYYKDFSIDVAVGEMCFCTLTVEGLAESETVADAGGDPAPTGASTFMLIQPVAIAGAALVATNVPETDYAEWSPTTIYALNARVIKAATHRIYESAAANNLGNDPTGQSGVWIDIGPTNRWAMFDEALGTVTTRSGGITLTIAPGSVGALALLDVVGATVRVQKGAYDKTKAVSGGAVTFLDMPTAAANIVITIAGVGTVSVGTLLAGKLVTLGITEENPSAGITDFSRKEVDDFGDATIVERAWAKRFEARSLIRTDAVDIVANRIAAVRARPALWIAADGTDALTVYGFFKDFSIEVDQTVSKVSLSIEGLSKAAPPPPAEPPSAPPTDISPTPPLELPEGTLWIASDGHPYRFGARPWTSRGALWLGADGAPWLGTGYSDAQDQAGPNALSAAQAAAALAIDAQATADGKVQSFYAPTAPTAEGIGDLWFDTDDGNKQYRWSGSAWVVVQDTAIGTALTNAAGAQATADGKVTTFFGSATPTAEGVGDLWYNDATSYLSRWSGSAWVAVSNIGATAAQIVQIGQALTDAANAQATADGKVDTFYQTTPPVGTIGDLWFDTDDGRKLYRHDGAGWVVAQDGGIGAAISAAAGAQATADGKVTTFVGETAPTPEGVGDLWYKPSTGYLARWSGSAWADIANIGATAAQITSIGNALTAASNAQATADGKVDTYYQTSAPAGTIGDLWFDTDDGNKLYRHNGSSWVAAQDAGIGNAITAAAGAQATADGKVTTFVGNSAPGAVATGDLWFNASTGELRRWSGSAWGDPLVDLTSAAQIIVVPPSTITLYRTWDGAMKADQLPLTVRPAVTRGGVDKRTDNSISYSVVGTGGLAGKLSVDNTNGSASKGEITLANTITSGGSIQLSVSASGIAVGTYVTLVPTSDDTPPIDNGTNGGTDSSLETVTSTSYAVLSGQDAGDAVMDVAIASGQTLKLNANFSYRNNSTAALTMTCKGQYSLDGSTWSDMNSGTTEATGSVAQKLLEPVEYSEGSMSATFTKTGLSAATYKVRLLGKLTSGTGILTPTSGGATSSKS